LYEIYTELKLELIKEKSYVLNRIKNWK